MERVTLDVSPEEAARLIAEQKAQIDRLTYQVERRQELYESAMRIVRRYQGERASFLARVEAALLGIASASPD